ncbi:MAG TPA: hypothetical protein VLF71_04405 [Candidatus Saccharimonadales bacterium]|nr:hypothetical protein [Candidatus Saccharimonadales bacterium]
MRGELPFAETAHNPDVLATLHNTLQEAFADPANPAASLAAQQEQFSAIVTAAEAQLPYELARNLLGHYRTVVEYMWFGGHTDAPPEAVGYYWAGSARDDDWGSPALKKSCIDAETFEAVTQTLMPLGLGNLLAERLNYAGQNQQKVEAAYKGLVDSMPGAKWLEAFKVGEPQAEMPLSALQRTPLEGEIRRTAATDPNAPSRLHPAVRPRTERQIQRLNEETRLRPDPRQHQDSALGLLRQHVESNIARYRTVSTPIVRQEYDADGSGLLDEYDSEGRLIASHDVAMIASVASDENGLPLAATYDLDILSRDFHMDVFTGVYRGLGSHQEVYDYALKRSRDTFLGYILSGFNLAGANVTEWALQHTKRFPETQPFDEDERERLANAHGAFEAIERPSHVTAHELEQGRQLRVGTIEKYTNPVPGTTRLLQRQYRLKKLPAQPPEGTGADLIMTLRNFDDDPHVPGYELVAVDRLQRRYYFTYKPNADPYRPNNKPVSEAARRRLASQYPPGLAPLAEEVRTAQDVTMSSLADISQRHSTYTLRNPLRPDFGGALKDLESFSLFVENHRLRGTCAIYSAFGKFSLGAALPKQKTAIIGGFVLIEGEETISGAGHAQVAIYNKSRQKIISIIDWTPAEGSAALTYTGSQESLRGTLNSALPEPQGSLRRFLGPPLDVRRQVKVSTDQLLSQLGVVFAPGAVGQIPPDYIFDRARRLGATHPIVQTLGALLRARDALETETTHKLPPQHMAEVLGALACVGQQRLRDRSGANSAQLAMLEGALVPVARFSNEPKINELYRA